MIEALKGWIVTICTAVFFITAIEIVLPDNSLKKYAKFVLGLILISVLIKPLIKIFDKNYDINVYASNAEKFFQQQDYKSDYNKLKDKNVGNTLEAFELNLKTVCESKLKGKFPSSNYTVDVKAEYIKQNNTFEIRAINVGVKDGKIESIKKVIVAPKSSAVQNKQIMNDQFGSSIRDYLCGELGISKDIITIYKN
jgi:stage III sporulation protein AF